MAKKKSSPGAHKSEPAKKSGADKGAPAKSGGKTIWILGGLLLAIVLIATVVSQGGKGSAGTAGGPPKATAEEAKYIGRYLPSGYESPNVGATTIQAKPMTPVSAKATDKALTLAESDVKANGIVSFEYEKSASEKIPMIAYVRPSGKLFVGVSYCVPCQGTGQSFGDDGTLTCDSCGTKRDLESGVGISGACKLYPLDELPVTLVDGTISIDKSVLDSWTVQPTDRPVG